MLVPSGDCSCAAHPSITTCSPALIRNLARPAQAIVLLPCHRGREDPAEDILKRLILTVFIVFLLGVAASAAYNVVYLRRLNQRYPVPGKFYEVNGHSMHLYC